MNKKEVVVIAILAVLIAAMDISGIPSAFFVNIHLADINPIYFTLMVNFLLIGVLAFIVLKFFCPNWKLGLGKEGFGKGMRKYGLIGIAISIIGLIAFWVGLYPFDAHPSFPKVLVEGIIYYIGVAIVEELYIRGLLLNLIEKLSYKSQNATLIAVIVSSSVFGLGHIFGTLGQSPLVIVSKVVWTIGMGLFFGMIYKRTGNLWVPIVIHFLINICALPYCFSTMQTYPTVTLLIVVPAYLFLGIYSIASMTRS